MTRLPFSRLFATVEGAPRAAALSSLAAGVRLALLAPIPILAQWLFASVEGGRAGSRLVGLGAGILALQVGATVVGLAGRRVVLRATQQSLQRLRERVLAKVYAVPRRYHDHVTSGELHDLVVHDTGRIESMVFVLLADGVPSAVLSMGLAALLAAYQWRLFLVALCLAPVGLVVARRSSSRLSAAAQRAQAALRDHSRGVLTALRSLDLSHVHGTGFELGRQRQGIEALREASERSLLLFDVSGAVQQTLVATSIVVVMLAGGAWIAVGGLRVDQLVFFVAGLALLRGPVTTLILSAPPLVAGQRSLERVEAFLAESEGQPYRGTRRIGFAGALEFHDVAFRYTDEALLDGVSLRLEPGEIVALAGANGVGKTTLVRLLLGLIRPVRGELRADGIAYEELDMDALRQSFGVLLQEPVVLAGSIRDNVTYGRPYIKDTDLHRALEASGAARWTRHLPAGLDTPVGERGALLSAGQAQQIALARALVGSPRLLVLDEPTNHLDEASVERVLRGLRGGDTPTTLVVSHERRVLGCADRVVRLVGGRLEQAGRP